MLIADSRIASSETEGRQYLSDMAFCEDLAGSIVRTDLQNPANTRSYVIDGLGHVRALVNSDGAITEV